MKIRAIRLFMQTAIGPHGYEFQFGDRLTIVRANNSSGKSTFFHTLLYAIGMEELLGTRGEKSLQTAVREQFIDGDEKKIRGWQPEAHEQSRYVGSDWCLQISEQP